ARVCRVGVRDAFCTLPGSHRAQLEAAGVSTGQVVAAARAALGVPPAARTRAGARAGAPAGTAATAGTGGTTSTTRAGRRAGVPVTGLPAGNHRRRHIP